MNIYAEGENVIFGQIGHLLVILAFVSALAATFSYFMTVRKSAVTGDAETWLSTARRWFLLHAISVIGIAAFLIVMIQQHLFEFNYVYQHSSTELPFRFLLSAFWEGQEGSTLLWMFWHSILGIVLLFTAKKWEASVMTFVSLAQVLLGSMVLGIIIKVPDIQIDFSPFFFAFNWADYKLGSSPFSLLKDIKDLPVFQINPGYIPEDGNGLNPLLQNYWMVIHPPTLFLGFAATTVPFAYAMASLWVRNYTDWLKPAFNWALFTLLILGVGILMGGAWAYEALSFGGFWAWDPVENASLVPWLLMAAGVHTLMAYKHTGHSLGASYLFLIGSFLLILYSSFLTKSGVLGDSSVHSFTDMGMSAQLVIMIFIFLIPAIILMVIRYKELPSKEKEEKVTSREFWLFIGSIIFLVSALHIIIFTSFPVINKIIGTNYAPPDPAHYNSVEIWIAIMLAIGSATSQYFAYKTSNIKKVATITAILLGISLLISIPIVWHFQFQRVDYMLLVFTAVYAAIANGYYIAGRLKNRMLHAGGSVTHVGFAIFILGILISQGRQHVVSLNKFGINYGESFSEQEIQENILLYQDEPQMMSGFRVTYKGDSLAKPNVYFKVLYEDVDTATGKVKESFVLEPNVQFNPKMGNVANPSTYRALNKDLYTHITTAPLKEDGTPADSLLVDVSKVSVGDTIFASRCFAIYEGINTQPDPGNIQLKKGDILISARLKLFTADTSYTIEPKYFIRDLLASSIPAKVEDPDVRFSLTKIYPEEQKIEITVEQTLKKYIIMKAIIFPYINLLWLGCFVMAGGIAMSLRKRYKESKSK